MALLKILVLTERALKKDGPPFQTGRGPDRATRCRPCLGATHAAVDAAGRRTLPGRAQRFGASERGGVAWRLKVLIALYKLTVHTL